MADKLSGVDSELVLKVQRILQAMAALGYPMIVVSGIRTKAEQMALYARGRTGPGSVVTQLDGVTRRSKHQEGQAVDCTFVGVDGRPRWVDSDPWALYGAMARSQGLVWGGDWRTFKDRPHIELAHR